MLREVTITLLIFGLLKAGQVYRQDREGNGQFASVARMVPKAEEEHTWIYLSTENQLFEFEQNESFAVVVRPYHPASAEQEREVRQQLAQTIQAQANKS